MTGIGSRPLTAFRRFFSTMERPSLVRFVVTVSLCIAAMWVCSFANYLIGLPLNIVAGVVFGGAFAKLVTESVGRMRAAGWNLRMVGWVAVGLGLAFVVLLVNRPYRVYEGLIGLAALTIGLALIGALSPATPAPPSTSPATPPPRSDAIFAAICIALGIVVFGGIAYISMEMRANTERRVMWEAERERARGGRPEASP